MSARPLLAIFEPFPVHYHAEVYRMLHRLCASEGLSDAVHVVYGTDFNLRGYRDPGFGSTVAWGTGVIEGYSNEILGSTRGSNPLAGRWSITGRGVLGALRRLRPGAVMITQFGVEFDFAAMWLARLVGAEVWLRTENQDEAFRRGRAKAIMRDLIYRVLYRGIDQAFYIGELNRRHLLRLGFRPDQLFFSPYCVRNPFMDVDWPRDGTRLKREARQALGLTADAHVLLFVGKIFDKKNPLVVPEAAAVLTSDLRRRLHVVYAGTGALAGAVKAAFARDCPDVRLSMPGFVTQANLPRYYLAADSLLLPSRQAGETWGLVVNEAMQAGLRVMASRHVGAAVEFAGLADFHVFDGSALALAPLLAHAIGHEADADAQRREVQRYSVEAAAAGMMPELRRLAARRNQR
jgi:glycosyltransferase involved in cell wall biosynthesis